MSVHMAFMLLTLREAEEKILIGNCLIGKREVWRNEYKNEQERMHIYAVIQI
jgi:hypothetical protein